jgi:hypothetical protein
VKEDAIDRIDRSWHAQYTRMVLCKSLGAKIWMYLQEKRWEEEKNDYLVRASRKRRFRYANQGTSD